MQARIPAPLLHAPLLIGMILGDNSPATCRRESPERAFSHSRLAAPLCEQGSRPGEAGMRRGAGARAQRAGVAGRPSHPGLCCPHSIHTHTRQRVICTPFIFFCLQLVYLISVCLDCLLLWASCCDQNLIILGDVVALYIGKGQWSITASSCDAGQITKAPITSLLCTCSGSTGWLGVTLLVMGMDLFHSYSLCCYWTWAVVSLLKQRSERTASFCVAPVCIQWPRCCSSCFQLVTVLLICTHCCGFGLQRENPVTDIWLSMNYIQCLRGFFSSSSMLDSSALLLLGCKIAVSALPFVRSGVMVWWQQPCGRPSSVLSRLIWHGHHRPIPCPPGPYHWLT